MPNLDSKCSRCFVKSPFKRVIHVFLHRNVKACTSFIALLLTMTALDANSEDHSYAWQAGERPSSILDGRVVFTYDDKGEILTMKVSPENGGRIIFTGDKMQFHSSDGSGTYITNTAPGSVIFQNEVGMRSLSAYVKTSDLKWMGYSKFIGEDWVTIAENANIDDYEPDESVQYDKSENGETLYYWANRGYRMYPCCIVRDQGRMTFQFQSKTDSASGRKYVMVVKMEARQSGNNIQMRAIAPAYKVWSDSSTPLDRGFDVDTLWIGIDKEAYPLRISGSSVTGCGINTVSMKHVRINAVYRFEGPVTITGSATPYRGTKFEIAYKLNDPTYPNVRNGGTFSLQNRNRDLSWSASGGGGVFEFASTAYMHNGYTVSVTGDWLPSGNGEFVVKGIENSPMVLDVVDNRALPSNGVATVKEGGVLRLSAAGADEFRGARNGSCVFRVEKGGILQQRNVNVFATNQVIELNGGKLELGWNDIGGEDVGTDLCRVTLKNGANIVNNSEKPLCLGLHTGQASFWIVTGTAPSTNNATVKFCASKGMAISNTFNVVSTGGADADFVWSADFLPYSHEGASLPGVLRKIGTGKMLINGRYDIPGAVVVEGGSIELGKSYSWGRTDADRASLVLCGGVFAAADATTNMLGKVVLKENSNLVLGENSSLAIQDLSDVEWAAGKTLDVSVPTNSAGVFLSSISFGSAASGLTEEQRLSLCVNGGIRFVVDDNGSLRPLRLGMVVILK